MPAAHSPRNFGLDILRSIAIILVILEHIDWFFLAIIPGNYLKAWSVNGFLGVELFFVLSGFLIGSIIFKLNLVKNRAAIKTFYLRRWARTLPLYYIALLIFMLINLKYHLYGLRYLPYFFFLQNIFPDPSGFFDVSWSLVIEEWFYLILPWIVYLLVSFQITKKRLLTSFLTIVIILIVIRAGFVLGSDISFDQGIKKSTFFDFDSLLIGVILALIKKEYPHIFNYFQKLKVVLLALVLLICFTFYYIFVATYSDFNSSFFIKSFSFPVVAICMAVFIGFFSQSSLINKKISTIKPIFIFFTTISLISYSMYVWHYEINRHLSHGGTNSTVSIPIILLSLVLTVVVSMLTYRWIEKPFLKLRNKLGKSIPNHKSMI